MAVIDSILTRGRPQKTGGMNNIRGSGDANDSDTLSATNNLERLLVFSLHCFGDEGLIIADVLRTCGRYWICGDM